MAATVLAALLATMTAAAGPAGHGAAAAPAGEPVVVPHAETLVMTAAGTGRRYRIFLARPTEPPAEAGYPVLYFLDGNATFQTAAEAMRLQTRPPKGFEPAAVVAVGYETEAPLDPVRRYLDFTTPADAEALPRRPGRPVPEVGGAEDFLDFLEGELMPEVARRLPVDPRRATLVGHSLGGFLVLHAFLTRPSLFSTHVAGSPSVWWHHHELLTRAEAFVAAGPDLAGRRLVIGIGGDELPDMVTDASRIAAVLAPLEEHGLQLDHVTFPGEEHTTVVPALVSRSFAVSLELLPGALE